MAPFDQSKIGCVFSYTRAAQDFVGPRPRCADQNARRQFRRHTVLLDENAPVITAASRRAHLRTGRDLCSVRCGVPRIEYDQPGIVHLAIRVHEASSEVRLQRGAVVMRAQRHGLGAGQRTAAAQVVIKEEAEPEQSAGPQAWGVGQHEGQRPDDVRRTREQNFALGKRFAD